MIRKQMKDSVWWRPDLRWPVMVLRMIDIRWWPETGPFLSDGWEPLLKGGNQTLLFDIDLNCRHLLLCCEKSIKIKCFIAIIFLDPFYSWDLASLKEVQEKIHTCTEKIKWKSTSNIDWTTTEYYIWNSQKSLMTTMNVKKVVHILKSSVNLSIYFLCWTLKEEG